MSEVSAPNPNLAKWKWNPKLRAKYAIRWR